MSKKQKNLSNLMESELEKAELVLAAKGLSQEVQDMTEKVAKLRVDDLMPLVDRIKETFGQSEGEAFQQAVDGQLQQLQEMLTSTKDELENQALVLNGEAPPESDMGMDTDMDSDMDMDDELGGEEFGDEEFDSEEEADIDDMFGASDADAGGEEPMGRPAKESVKKSKNKKLAEKRNALLKKKKMLENKIAKIKKAREMMSK